MELFTILTQGLFKFRRNALIETIDQVKMNLDDHAIPVLSQAASTFPLLETKGRGYVKMMDLFYEKTEVRKGANWIQDWLTLIQAARQNVNFLEEQVKKVMENDTYSDGMSIAKAQIVSAIAAHEYIANSTTALVGYLFASAEDTVTGKKSIAAGFERDMESVAAKVFSLLANHGQTLTHYKSIFKELPDAIVTTANKDQVLSSWGKKADPFNDVASGFVPNFQLMIVDTIVTVRLWKYNRDKLIKKQIEGRILYLESRKNGDNTASLEKQIEFYEKDVAKLQDKIEAFESQYRD